MLSNILAFFLALPLFANVLGVEGSSGRPIKKLNQVAMLIEAIEMNTEPFPEFSKSRFPVLYATRKSNFVLNKIRISEIKLDEAARVHLAKFPFYRDVTAQVSALSNYPPSCKGCSREGYLPWIRTNLPVFSNPANWHQLWKHLSVLETITDRLFDIFHNDEDEQMLRNQYCAYLKGTSAEQLKLDILLPVRRLGREFDCNAPKAINNNNNNNNNSLPVISEIYENPQEYPIFEKVSSDAIDSRKYDEDDEDNDDGDDYNDDGDDYNDDGDDYDDDGDDYDDAEDDDDDKDNKDDKEDDHVGVDMTGTMDSGEHNASDSVMLPPAPPLSNNNTPLCKTNKRRPFLKIAIKWNQGIYPSFKELFDN